MSQTHSTGSLWLPKQDSHGLFICLLCNSDVGQQSPPPAQEARVRSAGKVRPFMKRSMTSLTPCTSLFLLVRRSAYTSLSRSKGFQSLPWSTAPARPSGDRQRQPAEMKELPFASPEWKIPGVSIQCTAHRLTKFNIWGARGHLADRPFQHEFMVRAT